MHKMARKSVTMLTLIFMLFHFAVATHNTVYNRRCPPVEPGQIGTCGTCPPTCFRGYICCPNGCGSQCVPIPNRPVRKCKRPVGYTSQSSFSLRCSNLYNIGSVCSVVCPERTTLVGPSQTRCLSNRKWNRNLVGTSCVPTIICPPGVREVPCLVSPCQFASCPGVPGAVCVDSFCGACDAVFFLNGRRLSQEQCSPKVHDKRCLPVKPGQIGTCGTCPPSCSPGYICCPNGCGSQCVQIPNNPGRCFPRVDRQTRVSYNARCSQSNSIGSRCDITCSSNTTLRGSTRVQCLPSGRWSGNIKATQCVPRPRCRRFCPNSPCKNSECSRVKNAVCVVDTCKCRANYYVNGKKINIKRCLPSRRCFPRVDRQTRVSYNARCSQSNSIGSRCDITCSSNTTLRGSTRVQCLPSGRWSGNLKATQCVPRPRCRRFCPNSPCKNSECSRVKNAVCVVDTCTCQANYYVNGKMIDIQRCLPSRRCFPRVDRQTDVSYRARCSRSNSIGSRCIITCSRNTTLRGSSRVRCLSSGRWSGNLEATQCVPRPRCRRFCPNSPCRNSECSRVPNAVCVVDTCTCQANYYVNGKKIDIQRCLPYRRCFPRVDRQNNVSYRARCSRSNNIGSRCDITCSSNTTLRGSSRVQCLSSGEWSENLETTQCVPRPRCRRFCPDIRLDLCECPRVPNAVCVLDTCTCQVNYYENGKKIDFQSC